MKRTLIFIAVLALLAFGSNAQTTFGVRAGVNFQNINGEDSDGDKLKNDLTIGFNVGANAEIPVSPDFYFQPGLLFSTKGAKNLNEVEDLKLGLSYVELPLHIVYKPQLGNGKLILGFGPYIGYGVSGKYKYDNEEEKVKFKNDVKSSDEDAFYLKGLDAGADIFFGYELASKLSVQLNAQLGLLNLLPKYEGESSDATFKNTGFGISVGYRF